MSLDYYKNTKNNSNSDLNLHKSDVDVSGGTQMKIDKNKRVVVITGASGGIGLATAQACVKNGDIVFGLNRSGKNVSGVIYIPCDVSDELSVNAAFDLIENQAGKIDVLILNAGFGISGPVETAKIEDALKQFDVNYFGAVRCINAAGKLLRKNGGKIIFVSSLAAVLPIPFQAHYSASKSAINTLCRALNSELRPFNVRCTSIMPGDICTGFTDKRIKNETDTLYTAANKAVLKMEQDEQNGMPPAKIANLIVKVSKKRCPKIFYTKGFSYKLFMFLSKILPARIIDFIVRKTYL